MKTKINLQKIQIQINKVLKLQRKRTKRKMIRNQNLKNHSQVSIKKFNNKFLFFSHRVY